MNKKTIIWIITGVLAIVLIVGVSVFVNKNKNEAEKETDDLVKEREKTSEETKTNDDVFDFDQESLKTKSEIASIINEYKSEDEEISEGEIAEKLTEEYGGTVGL